MIGGQLVLDGINYQIVEGEIPELNQDGTPTGKTRAIKSLLIKDAHSSLVVEVRMLPDQFDVFAAHMQGRKTIIPNGPVRL